MHRRVVVLGAVLALAAWLVPPALGVQAEQDRVVSDDPADWTPNVLNGSVQSIVQVGNTMIVGGDFSQVQEPGGPILTRNNIFAFNATTGDVSTSFAPNLDGEVSALQVSADGQSVYVSGFFANVNGVRQRGLTRLNLSNGSRVVSFDPGNLTGRVKDLRLSGGRLYVGGSFGSVGGVDRPALVSLDPTTGALTDFVDVGFADPRNGGALQVMKMDVSPDGSRLVAIGNFNTVGGQSRPQLVVIDLTGPQASVANWQTSFFAPNCAAVFDSYMRDLDISPDGSYFVITTTGAYRGSTSPCDVTTRWELGLDQTDIAPTWRNYTGGDTTYAVAITGTAVYVGGHFRWQNNPFAGDQQGPGAVPREGIAALDPVNGLPFSWDPGRAKGVGVFDFLATEEGLWVGSDTDRIAWENHGRLAFLPLAGGTEVPTPFSGDLPNDVYMAGATGASASSPVLHRVNAGGPPLLAIDSGPDWAGDTAGAPSPLHVSGSNAAGWSSLGSIDATVPSSTPIGVFLSERWDPSGAPPMEWNLPVAAGTPIEVRLYLAAQCTCTNDPGERVFNVAIDGVPRLTSYDIAADVGFSRGTMKSFDIVSDGNVDIDFSHIVENPLVNAIEIVRTDVTTPPPGTGENDQVHLRSYDGTTAGATSTLPSSGIEWSRARGGVMLNGTLYTGWSDGNFYARTFNGSSFGAARAVNLYGLTEFSVDLQNTTGMFYDGGRLFFTRAGDNSLYYRYFTLESEVVGAQRYVATGSVTGLNWSTVSGMFRSGDHLYVVNSTNGNLQRIGWADGSVVQGTATTVSGPSIDGNDWRARALFLFSGENAEPPNQPPTAAASGSCTAAECSFSAVGSSDVDGTIASYEWDFGDGSTASGPTPSHTYAAEGSYTATLTVTDDDGATATDTVNVDVQVPNQLPTASFQVDCEERTCSFDASGSADPDGSITSYSWSFGDGESATGATTSHTYAADGDYAVELTVTDDEGATDVANQTLSVGVQADDIAFLGADSVNDNGRDFTVDVPAGTVAGDALLLFATQNRTDAVLTGPGPGWTQIDSVQDGSAITTVWQRVADATDAGGTVSLSTDVWTKLSLTLAAYHGVDSSSPVVVAAGEPGAGTTASRTTPTVDNSVGGAWRVSYWATKSSSVTGWTAPAGESTRDANVGQGNGRIAALLTDSGGAAGGGQQGGLTAVADASSGVATMWTILLRPNVAGAANMAPVADFSATCTALQCDFDASASNDPDGSVASYSWSFGDGSTATGPVPTHTYAAAGDYTVELTVTGDQGLDDVVSKTVSVAAQVDGITFVGEDTLNDNRTNFTVGVPSDVAAGDALLLFMAQNRTDAVVTGPGADWSQLDSVTDGSSVTTVWHKVATPTDAGNTVQVSTDVRTKAAVTLAAYRGTDGTAPIAAHAGIGLDGTSSSFTTPTVDNPATGALRLSFWSMKGSDVTAWTSPAGESTRSSSIGSGGGRIASLLTDSGTPVGTGPQGGLTAIADAVTGVASMWTIMMQPS